MKITLTVNDSELKFILIPENNVERKLISVLEDYSGKAIVRGEKDVEYGGSFYSNNFKHLIVTIKPNEKE
jgi:hypothetical protein